MSLLTKAISIFSGLAGGKLTWSQAQTEIESAGAKVFSSLPTSAQSSVTQAISDVKQGASNALAAADTLLGPAISTGATVVEGALDSLIAAYTGGLAVPLTAGVNDGVTALANGLKSAIDARLLQHQAALAATPPAVAPTPAPGQN